MDHDNSRVVDINRTQFATFDCEGIWFPGQPNFNLGEYWAYIDNLKLQDQNGIIPGAVACDTWFLINSSTCDDPYFSLI